MILDFDFVSASSEGSDEPVHLQSMTRAFAVHVQDEDSDQLLTITNNIINTIQQQTLLI